MKKFFKKLWRIITNRVLLIALSLLVQIALLVLVVVFLSFNSVAVYTAFSVLSVITCVFVISKDDNPAYKLAWVVPILALPFFGGFLYIVLGRRNMSPKRKKRMKHLLREAGEQLDKLSENASIPDPDSEKLAELIENSSSFPVFAGTQTQYLPCGEVYFETLICELEKAEKFIFMEFFIIRTGEFWDSVLKILERKAAEGVEVRIMYDDVGCLFKLPSKYDKRLRRAGMHVSVFNRLVPSLDTRMNNRTHRKIVVIDGKTAFTGGINISDEYINLRQPFGHWKDTGMVLRGRAVNSFTVMFLSFWAAANKAEKIDFAPYLAKTDEWADAKGFAQPLSGGPGRNEQLIERACIRMINTANKYVYINTPYLIIDNEMYTALCIAAKSGVDVRITAPHVPDKKAVFMMTRSFYPGLLKSGVKIYEYVPGFIHAKSMVSDDRAAYVGSCNMDYRSFYLHYECGTFVYDTESIDEIKKDYLNTLKECKPITYEEATDVTVFTKIARSFLRVFSPLL